MDLDELRAFLEVVDAGSVLAAADARGVSRTTLKRRIEELEARAGVSLMVTTSRGVVVTEAGRLLAERGRQISQEMGVLVSSLRRVRSEPEGTLRSIMPIGMPPQLLVQLFGALRVTWPKLRFDVRLSDDPLDAQLEHVDVAVHFGDAPKGPWDSFVLVNAELKLIGHRDYLRERGHPTTLAELEDHDLLCWRAPAGDPRSLPCLNGTRFPVDPAMIATDIHWLRSCCIQKLGLALVPDGLLPDPGLDPSALVRVLPELVGDHLPLRLSVPEMLADSPRVKVVVDQARRLVEMLNLSGGPGAGPAR